MCLLDLLLWEASLTDAPSCRVLNTTLHLLQGHVFLGLFSASDSTQRGYYGRPVPVRQTTPLTDDFGLKILQFCRNFMKALWQSKALPILPPVFLSPLLMGPMCVTV